MNRRVSKRSFKTLMVYVIFLFSFIINTAQADPLRIGTISKDTIDELRIFQPFADYLSTKLGKDDVEKVEVVIASSIVDAVSLLKNNQIDIFMDSSVTALIINELSGSKFMLRRWKKARDKYRSVVSVNTDSGISSLQDLIGKTVAFEEPFSTSGYFLPALAMLGEGLELSELPNLQSKPTAGKVGFVMAYDNETQIAWLERNRVSATAMAEKDYLEFSKNALNPMTAIHFTPFVPYHVVTHRKGLDPIFVQRIKEVLKSADQTKDGQIAMEEFENTTRFDKIPDDLLPDLEALKPFLVTISNDALSE